VPVSYGEYTNSVAMPVCVICGTETKFLYHEYNQFKLRPPRCLGCILKFPPPGFVPHYRIKKPVMKYRHHQWAVIQQDDIGEDWLCLRCKKFLSSPGLGYPSSVACNRGTDKTLRNVFWADKGLNVVCPKCRRPADIVEGKVVDRYKLGKRFSAYVCQYVGCV